jgi:hypothetical protein
MAEREQADIADQQIERAGEQGEAQRLHQEQRIDEHRRDEQRDHHRNEGDRFAAAGGGPRLGADLFGDRRHLRRRARTGPPA